MVAVRFACVGMDTKEFAMLESSMTRRGIRVGVRVLATVAMAAFCLSVEVAGGDAVGVPGGTYKGSGRVVGSLPTVVTAALPIPGGGSVGPIGFGGGGTYEGPGDTVPPGPGNGNIGICTMNLPPVVCSGTPSCDSGWDWTPDDPRCVWPKFGPFSEDPLYAQGFMLTIGDVLQLFQQGNACIDSYGNITACIMAPIDVHEVHVFQSGWINGYIANVPIADAVGATVCVDGTLLMSGWSFQEVAQARPCDYPTVCVSFNAECLFEALRDWSESGVDLNQWSNSWLFYVDFVSCMPCEG
jgi:hypothetical protein